MKRIARGRSAVADMHRHFFGSSIHCNPDIVARPISRMVGDGRHRRLALFTVPGVEVKLIQSLQRGLRPQGGQSSWPRSFLRTIHDNRHHRLDGADQFRMIAHVQAVMGDLVQVHLTKPVDRRHQMALYVMSDVPAEKAAKITPGEQQSDAAAVVRLIRRRGFKSRRWRIDIAGKAQHPLFRGHHPQFDPLILQRDHIAGL